MSLAGSYRHYWEPPTVIASTRLPIVSHLQWIDAIRMTQRREAASHARGDNLLRSLTLYTSDISHLASTAGHARSPLSRPAGDPLDNGETPSRASRAQASGSSSMNSDFVHDCAIKHYINRSSYTKTTLFSGLRPVSPIAAWHITAIHWWNSPNPTKQIVFVQETSQSYFGQPLRRKALYVIYRTSKVASRFVQTPSRWEAFPRF